MINNNKFQKFVTATMLGTFLALAANPVIAQIQEDTNSLQDQAVATAQAEIKDQNLPEFLTTQDILNSKETINKLSKEINFNFAQKKKDRAILESDMDINDISNFSHNDGTSYVEIFLKTGTSFEIDQEYAKEFSLNDSQISSAQKIVETANFNYENGFFSTPMSFKLQFNKYNAFEIKDLKQSFSKTLQDSIKNEVKFNQKVSEIKQLSEKINNSGDKNIFEINKLYNNYESLNSELSNIPYINKDRVSFAYNHFKDGDIGIQYIKKGTMDDNFAVLPSFYNNSTCTITLSSDLSGLKSSFIGTSLLSPVNIETASHQSFLKEFVTTHEMSHCEFDSLPFEIQTGNDSIDFQMNNLFSQDTYSSGQSQFVKTMHENFSDSYTYMIMLQKYGKNNKELNDFFKELTDTRISSNSLDHQTNLSLHMLQNSDMQDIILKTSPNELKELAVKISSVGTLKTLAHVQSFQDSIKNSFGPSPFHSPILKDVMIKTLSDKLDLFNSKDSKSNKNLYFNGFSKIFNDAIERFQANNGEDGLNVLLAGITSKTNNEAYFKVANELWKDTTFKNEYNIFKDIYRKNIDNVIKYSKEFKSEFTNNIGLDLEYHLSIENQKNVIENLTNKKFEFNTSVVQKNLKSMLEQYAIKDIKASSIKPL